MVTPEQCRVMARYNQWQNRSIINAARRLDDAARWEHRGAFFGSIAQTLNHILWDDRIWLARLAREPRDDTIPYPHPYKDEPTEWAAYEGMRFELDEELVAWADGVDEDLLKREIRWSRSGEERRPSCGFCILHLFNHQTHHRGQVHAMLTMAGTRPDETDLHAAPGLEKYSFGLP